ncbi:MAG: response regulator [bacterium]|nr:response regulator [bacterium]
MEDQVSKKILIVEDELPLLSILAKKFSAAGYETHEAKNGSEGLELAEQKQPDIILLDLVMPHMDGIDMLKKMRSTSWGKSLLVLILTNLSDPFLMREAEELGVNSSDYLIKADLRINDVLKKVDERLKSRG